MNLAEMKIELRIELSDGATFFTDAELARAVTKTVSMLSRFIPKRAIVETTLTRSITGESLTIASSAGTLANKPVKPGTVVITGKVLDTDYTVNYITGVVTEIGALLPDTDYTVEYELDDNMLDISSLLPEEDYIKIERVEYPVGDDPPTIVTFEVFGEILLVKGRGVDLVETNHIRIIYLKPWTAPATAVDGDYPEHLDNAIIIGSAGQALIFKAEKYVQQSITELELVNAAADSMATPLAAINTALGKVDALVTLATTALDKVGDYLESNGTTDNAKEVLANITDDIADLRTAIETALDLSGTYLTGATAPATKKYLEDGDAFIESINDGEDVAGKYADYAIAAAQLYQGLVTEATVRLDNIRTYIEEASGWMRMGDTFIAEAGQRLNQAGAFVGEASQRVAEVNAWAVQADRYALTSREYLTIAGRYLASGQAKINEFLVSLGIKPEFMTQRGSSEQFS